MAAHSNRHAPPVFTVTALGRGLAMRLGVAVLASALVWIAVLWALD